MTSVADPNSLARSTTDSAAKHRAEPPVHQGKRLDIQGLRMLAVVSVVLNHLTGWPGGGFTGVDVFFVISGYLITGRLVRTSGTKSVGSYFASFYVLRARRILPAALLTLALTVLAAHYAFAEARAHSVSVDALWSAIFLANWHFAAIGTSYFSQNVPVSPLQHFWSLAVEEQFYLVWPVVVLIVVGIAGSRGRRVGIPVAVGAGAISVVTFVFGWSETVHHPQTAYFSTFARGWELGLGAVLACLMPMMKPARRGLAAVVGWLGVALIFAGFLWTPTDHGFPVPWAALAVGGSALVIAAGGLGVTSGNWLLTNRVSVFLGDISYSIYLTHFPLVIIFGALITTSTLDYYTAVLVGTLGLSMLSYYLVEEPARTGSFSRHARLNRRVLVALACCAAMTTAYAMRPPIPVPSFAKQSAVQRPKVALPGTGLNEVTPLPALQGALEQSLQLTSWPTLINQATVDRGRNTETCERPGTTECTYSPAGTVGSTKTVVLLGDSVMVTWLSMMKAVFLHNGWRVVQLAESDCFGADAHYADTLQGNGGAMSENEACDKQHVYVRSVLRRLHPNLVLIDNMSDAIYKVSDGHGTLLPHRAQVAQYEAGLRRTIQQVKAVGAQAVLLSATPNHREWANCQVAGSTPLNCVRPPEKRWYEIQKSDLAVAKKSGAIYLDTLPLWCITGECPNVVGKLAAVVNSHHITQEYGVYVAPSLESALRQLKLI